MSSIEIGLILSVLVLYGGKEWGSRGWLVGWWVGWFGCLVRTERVLFFFPSAAAKKMEYRRDKTWKVDEQNQNRFRGWRWGWRWGWSISRHVHTHSHTHTHVHCKRRVLDFDEIKRTRRNRAEGRKTQETDVENGAGNGGHETKRSSTPFRYDGGTRKWNRFVDKIITHPHLLHIERRCFVFFCFPFRFSGSIDSWSKEREREKERKRHRFNGKSRYPIKN